MRKCKALIIFTLAFSLVLGLCGCGSEKAGVTVYPKSDTAVKASEEAADTQLYFSDKTRSELKKVSDNGTCMLYFDEQTCTVSVYDSNSKKLWRSLPDEYRDEKPCALSVDVSVRGQTLSFDSQQGSVARSSALYEYTENGVTVSYGFRHTLDDGTKISFTVPVEYSVNDGVFTVSVDCAKIRSDDMSRDVSIKTIRLLNYFGSSVSGQSGDYVFVPDGCGTLLDTSSAAESFSPVTVPVYGADYAAGETDGKYRASVACFGVKSGESAFVALVEKGDADCFITASRANEKSGYNRVGAGFTLTKTYTDKESASTYTSNSGYEGEIKLSYRFLSGDSANYVGMAGACREALIRNGTLNFSSSELQGSLPMMLTVIGAAKTGEKGELTTLTSYEQAQELLSVFRGKGIGNMYVRYRGLFTGGLGQSDASKLRLSSRLGTEKQLSALIDYAATQNIVLFADANLLSAAPGELSQAAVDITGRTASADVADLKNAIFSYESQRELLSSSQLEKQTNTLLSFVRSLDFDGVCISDAGKLLYSDFNEKEPVTRQTLRDTAASQCSAVSSSKQLMINGANIYALKYACAIVNLPDSSSLASVDGGTQIPFLQILLHGFYDYSGTALNLYKNTETALLRAAEYGAVPSVDVYYADFGTDEAADMYHYPDSAAKAQLAYERMSAVFSDLRDKTITAHYKVQSKVYCTEYGSSVSVYVNYNTKDVTVNGVTVPARDFVRVG